MRVACVSTVRGLIDKAAPISRDRLGIKPFYHARVGGTFAFASEIPPLLAGGANHFGRVGVRLPAVPPEKTICASG